MQPIPYVLIVEDDRPIADAMRLLLEHEGFEVCVAPEGDAALSECEKRQPACIVLDYNMPVMDGGALIEELRWRPHLSGIPIVLTSAMRDLEVVARRLQIPYVLPKPFDAGFAADLVRRAIGESTAHRH